MKKIDALNDILQNRVSNQVFYNENLINITNPEIRAVYTQLRDDEMRSIVKLQQLINRLEHPSGIVSKIFPSKTKFQ
jgi:rubrerythrin